MARGISTAWSGPAVLAGLFVLLEFTALDLWVQDRFYDFERRRWLVDAGEPVGRLFFYDGPKAALILLALGLLGLAFGPARWRERWGFARRTLGVAIMTLITVPLLAGLGKDATNIFTPAQTRRYGGDVPYVKLFETYPANDRPVERGRGFPAGHASGGFALLGLYGLGRTRAWRRVVIALALGAGWVMGGYQMLKGAHYLSHTVATMLLAWVVVLVWSRIFPRNPRRAGRAEGAFGRVSNPGLSS